MCYSFDFLAPEKLSAERVRAVLESFGRVASDGWSCWAYSNHDVMRHASRWAQGESDRTAYLKVISALLMSLRGSVCLYQGEELGLGEADLNFDDLRDPYGIRFWPEFKGRDGCRTPMVWDDNETNAGFSTGRPWLPVAGRPSARLPSTGSRAIRIRCSNTTAASSIFVAPIRRSPRATSSSSRRKATPSPSRAARAMNSLSAPSTSATNRPRSTSAKGTRCSRWRGTALPAVSMDGQSD